MGKSDCGTILSAYWSVFECSCQSGDLQWLVSGCIERVITLLCYWGNERKTVNQQNIRLCYVMGETGQMQEG